MRRALLKTEQNRPKLLLLEEISDTDVIGLDRVAKIIDVKMIGNTVVRCRLLFLNERTH